MALRRLSRKKVSPSRLLACFPSYQSTMKIIRLRNTFRIGGISSESIAKFSDMAFNHIFLEMNGNTTLTVIRSLNHSTEASPFAHLLKEASKSGVRYPFGVTNINKLKVDVYHLVQE